MVSITMLFQQHGQVESTNPADLLGNEFGTYLKKLDA
jgi:hypothetical protein